MSDSPLSIYCPTCFAPAGVNCHGTGITVGARHPHTSRIRVVQTTRACEACHGIGCGHVDESGEYPCEVCSGIGRLALTVVP